MTTISPTWRTVATISFNTILSLRHPLAIAGFVILPMANSTNDITGRTRTHVCPESSEIFAPRQVHFYAFSPIPFVLFAVRIVTALFDFRPGDVFPSRFASLLAAFRRTVRLQMRVRSMATAAFCIAVTQCPRFYLPLFPAQATAAQPQSPSFTLIHPDVFKHFPFAKPLPADVYQSHSHRPILA